MNKNAGGGQYYNMEDVSKVDRKAESDKTLTARYVADADEEAFAELVRRHGAMVYRLCLRVLGDAHEAEDAAQATFIVLLQRAKSLRRGEALAAWLHGTAYRVAREAVRARVRRAEQKETACMMREVIPPPSPLEEADKQEVLRRLDVELAALPRLERQAVVLMYLEGHSQATAAVIAGCPQGTLGRCASQGLERLRRRLTRRGHATGLAVLVGLLESEARAAAPESLPATLRAVSQKAAAKAAAGGVEKGGLAMKVFGGVLLAGILAGAVTAARPAPSLESGGSAPAAAAGAAAKQRPKLKLFAACVSRGYLDGPRLEAMSLDHKVAACDEQGNLFFVLIFANGVLRVARADNGLVETVTGDDRWGTDFGLSEGPASAMPDLAGAVGCGSGAGWIKPVGDPLAGEAHGCLYLGAMGGYPCKVFRNAEKGGRWWFKRLGGTGKQALPTVVGQSADLDKTNLKTARIGRDKDGLLVAWKGNLYRLDEKMNRLTCLLTIADYEKVAGRGHPGRAGGGLGISESGCFYLMHFKGNALFRISADRKKVEKVVQHVGRQGRNKDGPGLKTSYHCGPYSFELYKHFVFLKSIDSNAVRRFDEKNGRVSTLCTDGEFRENGAPGQKRIKALRAKGWMPGRAGGTEYIYIPYPGEEMGGCCGMWRFGPVDLAKPTTGPLVKQ